jgi:hypothetical protein
MQEYERWNRSHMWPVWASYARREHAPFRLTRGYDAITQERAGRLT